MITYLENERQFQLDTPHASYVLTVAEEGYVLHTYWGKRIAPQDLTDLLRLSDPPFVPAKNERERASFLDCAPFEYPCAGIGDYREPAIVLEDGAFACDLRYVSHRIYNGKYAPRCLPIFSAISSAVVTELYLGCMSQAMTCGITSRSFAYLSVVSSSALTLRRSARSPI